MVNKNYGKVKTVSVVLNQPGICLVYWRRECQCIGTNTGVVIILNQVELKKSVDPGN